MMMMMSMTYEFAFQDSCKPFLSVSISLLQLLVVPGQHQLDIPKSM